MSRKGNCWDNAPQESFFGRMKDHIRDRLKECTEFVQVSSIVDDYMVYYNKERYQWELAKLSPDEFYEFYMTGEYPLNIKTPPLPVPEKPASELGKSLVKREREDGKHTD